jgi:hypothetical protein
MATFDLNTTASDFTAALTQGNVTTPIEYWKSQNENRKFIHQIRDQFYYIEIWLYNQIEGQKPFAVPFYFVNSLALEETLMDWFVKGWIVFNNNFEILERGANSRSSGTDAKEKIEAPYIFRTDGRNRISIKIYPIPNNQTYTINVGETESELPKDKWEMSFDCVIYDVEDLPTGSSQVKLRKFYFWDERYQIFLEKNIEWSTSKEADAWKLPDYERGMPANEALLNLIQTASLENPSSTSENTGNYIHVGYIDGGRIDNPTVPMGNYDLNWDMGNSNTITKKLPNGKEISYRNDLIFYTSPANNNVLDDMEYIISNVISKEGNPAFLRFGRYSEDKVWNLVGLEKYFRDAEKEQVERLFIEDGVEATKPYIPRAPSDFSSDIQNFMSGIASRIHQYKFSPMVAVDDNRIQNSPLHQYDFATGRFNIFYKENTAKEVINQMTTAGKQGLHSLKQASSHVLLNLNQTKNKGIMLNNMFSPKPFVPTNFPKIQMMKDALYLNESVCFITNGLTIRSPGRFIFIDHVNSNETNPFDDRFLGQWMITKVVHLFTQDNYVTEVVANKIDAFSRLWPNEDKKL